MQKCIFFDAVGTLIYPYPSVIETYQKIGNEFGYSITKDLLSTKFLSAHKKYFLSDKDHLSSETIEKNRWQNVVNEIFYSYNTPELFDQLWQHFSYAETWQVYKETEAMLVKLYKQGFYVGIASNFDNRLIKICQKHFPYLDTNNIFYSSQLGYAKPSLKFYETIEKEINNESSNCYMVGDDETNDIKAAIKAGWTAIHKDDIKKLEIELA